MAPQMSKATVAAAAVAGSAFVAPSRPVAAPTATTATGAATALRRGGHGSISLSTVGVALGATAVAALRSKESRVAVAPRRAFENELGVQPPLGFWDPAGLSSDGDAKEFYRRRVVEIKHGRVSMLACTGYIVQEFFRFPGYISPSSEIKFADIPNGLAAATKVPAVGWFQYTVFCGICDLWLMHQVPTNPPGKLCTRLFGEETTNYEYGFLGLPGYLGGKAIADPEVKKKKLNAEIANGRLAMMAIIGMFFQDGLTGSAWGDWANYTESPLRAFENELGVQPPLGFWDPAGLSSDGDAKEFYRRRVVEIKHGRVSMLACTGYIVQEFFRFPGYISPSSEIKFADIPNGLAAATKVPAVGWFQYTVFCGICDLWLMHQVPTNPPGKLCTRLFGEETTNYEYGFLGLPGYLGGKAIADPEVKKKKLNAEIANGRLAMMAIIGMFFQDGLTGSAWGDWANYTESPLRAFENELGVQPPLGFWDPAGLSSDGDAKEFYRRRVVEIKHGRVSMLACTGYIVQEFFRFPGYISPSSEIKFADIPNGLAAATKVPAVGWFQYTVFCGICDLWLMHQVPTNPPGKLCTRLFGEETTNYECGFLGLPGYLGGKAIADPEVKKKKLNAEIANGRLAMMAIIGMFFQDGLTGSAWGDWANYTESPLRSLRSDA
ncbi:unnamed protein product [Cladocopium goreaui]|uniref:Light-harvesting protein n=1 Tax=Cladocopium goreaui TaxID=2562237 RepID=A0A9P1DKH2_9DINO|nr:unnamed protein product [Cladocopium goreaui]